MGRKKSTNRTLVGMILLAVAFVAVFAFIQQSLQITTAFSVSEISLDGNTYYEDRCEDTTQCKDDGYSLVDINKNNCEILEKDFVVGTGQYVYDTCNGGSARIAEKCELTYGSGFTYLSCDGSRKRGYCGYITKDQCGGTIRVKNTCQFEQNDLLAGETFEGGKSISKDSLRYPVKGFCKAHPAIITDDSLKSSITSTSVYDDLQNGKTLNIPADETITIFYIMENNQNLPTQCDSGNNLALNVQNENTCLSTLGFTYLCSEGQFDALTGTCVVQASVSCSQGSYDSNLKKCVYTPKTEIECEGEFDSQRNVCLIEPKRLTICEKGRYDVQLDACVYNPPIQADCADDNAYFDVDEGFCKKRLSTNFVCEDGLTLIQPENQQECADVSGIWEECPQCPSDQICPDSICEPVCSTGQRCVDLDETAIASCNALVNESISSKGVCVGLDKQTNQQIEINLCRDGFLWNRNENYCEKQAETTQTCDEGYVKETDAITGKVTCFKEPEKYIRCDEGLVYNANVNKCVPQVLVYDPKTDDFVIYKEIVASCQSDDDCLQFGDNYACFEERNVCLDKRFEQRGKASLTDFLLLIGALALGVIGGLLLRK